MRYYDIYPPLVNLDKTYSIEDSISITRRALKPLGDEYMTAYDRGVKGRWMHVYPSPESALAPICLAAPTMFIPMCY